MALIDGKMLMIPPKVAQYLQSHAEEHLSALTELLAIPSVANYNAQDNQCDRAAKWVSDYLLGMGLDSRVIQTDGCPAVLAHTPAKPNVPTLLIYGHYDVQPGEPLEPWDSDPFKPQIRDGSIFARGASDDKGQMFAHIAAVEAYLKTGQPLPVNVKIFIEGEEEIGSPNLEKFLRDNSSDMSADFAVISDCAFFMDDVPSITYALRGLIAAEITVRGPDKDCHSGLCGGTVTNPLNGLASIIAKMHDADGRITLDGFYDDVLDLSSEEERMWANLPSDEREFTESLGLKTLGGGEKGLPFLHRRWARPTLDCNGISGGYSGPGAKTVLPSTASAKISMRLVSDQKPEKIISALRKFVTENTPAGLEASVETFNSANPVITPIDSLLAKSAAGAIEDAFGKKVVMIRNGATVPVVEVIPRILKIPTVLMGLGLPSDGIHGPNERFKVEQFHKSTLACAAFYRRLA